MLDENLPSFFLDVGSKEKSAIQTGAKDNSPTPSTGDRPPSETIRFISADDMRLDTRAPTSARASTTTTSEEEVNYKIPVVHHMITN